MDKTGLRISVITVTYNSENTLPGTIRSVLDQSFLPYEYIVVDGLSTDATVSVAESFRRDFDEKGIKFTVVSEKDNGMYDAMNKGIKIASGDVVGIINSDDRYERDAFLTVADTYETTPFDLFYADIRMVLPDGRSFVKHSRDRKYATSRDWNHPTTFITKEIYKNNKYRTDTLHDDYDLILRLKKEKVREKVVNKVLANFRMDGVSHRRGFRGAIKSIKLKYGIYRRNGYGWYYIIEPVMEEFGKLIIG